MKPGHVIYNPWSVLAFAEEPGLGPQPYWVSTSSSDVLRSAVLELKRLMRSSNETVEQGLDAALQQIRERNYAAELEARGASPVLRYGVVFDGKRVWVRMGLG